MRAAADPAAQLVQLRDAVAVGLLDHHHRRVRHVDADLDHAGRDQHVDLAGREARHHLALLARVHLAVHHRRRGSRANSPAREALALGRRGARLQRLGLLDQRADDEALPALAQALADELVRARRACARARPRSSPAGGPRGSSRSVVVSRSP